MIRTELRWAAFVPVLIVTDMLLTGCSSSDDGGGAAGGAGAGGDGGDGGYLDAQDLQDSYCDPHETEVECREKAGGTCGWYDMTWRAPADSCELVGPVGRCVWDSGGDTGYLPDDLCPGEPEFSRYWYRAAEPGWYDVLVLSGWAGMNFAYNGWNRCTIREGSDHPPFCECLCAVE